MKKLNKLQINPERIIKNDELNVLKGGYTWTCFCTGYDNYFPVTADTIDDALLALSNVCPGSGGCFA